METLHFSKNLKVLDSGDIRKSNEVRKSCSYFCSLYKYIVILNLKGYSKLDHISLYLGNGEKSVTRQQFTSRLTEHVNIDHKI